MEKKKELYMKYLVLKMEDRLNIHKLCAFCSEKGFNNPKVERIAEIIINCLTKDG